MDFVNFSDKGNLFGNKISTFLIKFFIYMCFNPVFEIIVFICTELFLSNMSTVQLARFNKIAIAL